MDNPTAYFGKFQAGKAGSEMTGGEIDGFGLLTTTFAKKKKIGWHGRIYLLTDFRHCNSLSSPNLTELNSANTACNRQLTLTSIPA